VSGSDGYLFAVNSRVEQVEAHEPDAEFLMNGNEQVPFCCARSKSATFGADPSATSPMSS
jgi:hypothetical protein